MRVPGLLVLVVCSSVPALSQSAGGLDHALGGSSVMWLPRASALFLNPAEIASVREGSLAFTTHRFSSLSSFSTSYFVPFVGTFAAGVTSFGPSNQYTVGFGGQWGNYEFGTSLSGFRNVEETFGLSLGASLHLNNQVARSGFHTGFSVVNLSENTLSPFFSVNVGTAYWLLDELLRLQAAFQHAAAKNFGLAGTEVVAVDGLAFQVGTRSFKEISGGFSVQFSHGSVDFSAAKSGVIFSINASLTEPASVARDRNNDLGLDALDQNRFAEAKRHFELAYVYDPFFPGARAAADSAEEAFKAEWSDAEEKARTHFNNKHYVDASKHYARLLEMDPDYDEARSRMKEIQILMHSYFVQLIVAGDSLRDRRETERARRSYQQALDLDPGNDSITTRIAGLKDLAQDNLRTMLARARTYLERNQLDEAEREFERVLGNEPRNSRARQGLASVRTKRTQAILEKGKQRFNEENYMEALGVFLQVLDREPNHREANDLLDRSRQYLKPQVETHFRTGLQSYTKGDYQAAIDEWDKGLLIDPNHQGTVEYRKRAEEKLEALKRLK
ncbi:MAG TPA: tetratricopeptide repeat protein [Bacteroidota bacterium]